MFKGRIKSNLIMMVLFVLVSAAHAGLPNQWQDGQPMPSLAPMIKTVSPSVVNIATYTTVHQRRTPLLNDPFYRRFFNNRQGGRMQQPDRHTNSAGSGVVVDARNGYILTNAHVVADADEIEVGLQDGRTLKAELVGVDEQVDIAVLKVAAENLTPIIITDSNSLEVGDFVIALGNPFGLGQTVTSGIVSALGRTGLGIEGYEDFIQTDASINPGNSGGALVNLRGELVGINTAIFAPSGGNIGIGFAIPTDMASVIMQQLIEYGEVRRGLLGVQVQELTPQLASAFEISEEEGLLITGVDRHSAAAHAGLMIGDIVLKADGKRIRHITDLKNQIGVVPIGHSLTLTVRREDGLHDIVATISEPILDQMQSAMFGEAFAGATLTDLPAGVDLDFGIFVHSIEDYSAAEDEGLRPGDVITAVNRKRVHDIRALKKLVQQSPTRLLLQVIRDRRSLFIAIELD